MFFDAYIEQALPHIVGAARTADEHARRICARLDAIHGAINDTDVVTARKVIDLTLTGQTAPPSANNPPLDVAQVPTDEMWILEVLHAVDFTAFGLPMLRLMADGRSRFTATPVGAATALFASDLGILFPGGTNITISAIASADIFPVFLQFRTYSTIPRRQLTSNAGGMMMGSDQMDVVNGDERGGTDATGRHGRMFEQGANIRGAARGDGLS